MAGSTFGKQFTITTWGESHGEAIGAVVDGCPAGLPLQKEDIQVYLDRRKPGSSPFSTPRKESDRVRILSGVFEGKTTGTPISLLIPNTSQRSADYSEIACYYRPGHADYTFDAKYGFRDYRGGGRSSGRETAGRVAGGAIAAKFLNELGIRVQAYTKSIGPVSIDPSRFDASAIPSTPTAMPDREADSRAQEWLKACGNWKKAYPVTQPRHWEEDGQYANVYAFIRHLSSVLPDGSLTVVSNGSACVVGSHNYVIQKDARFLINSAIASMGYGLPAAIGACRAAGGKETICIEGDGSLMMNLQELQTVLTNRLPIKLFLINNQGYHSIRQTQNNLFSGHSKVGIGPESGDLSFPDYEKIAKAFGYPYQSAHSNEAMKAAVEQTLAQEGPAFCEIFVSPEQVFEPKSGTRKLEDGSLFSPPLEDLAPFLPKEEIRRNLFIKPLKEYLE